MLLPVHPPARRTTLLAALLALLAGLAVTVQVSAQVAEAAATRRDRCVAHGNDSLERARLVTGHGAPVLVIGDSWSVGLGVGATSSWPSRLPGRVEVAGFSGSGFSPTSSHCGAHSYAVRAARVVPHGAPLVVVEGGLNDTDQATEAISRGFHRLVEELEARDVARVVVVGPAPAPARADAVPRVDRLLADLAAGAGVEYVSAAGWQLSYLRDGLHPDRAGHHEFGDLVAAALG